MSNSTQNRCSRATKLTRAARNASYRTNASEFYRLRFGLSDQQLADLAGVDRTTANRWRRGDSEVPFAVMELLRLRRGTLPRACGAFAGFRVVEDRLVPPDAHWQDGIAAREVKDWWLLRQRLVRR
ncbi:helix-turn-helix domain-containing protein [Neisseriaceae bacterium JH1-16]|nr:helix-turn-helix domain-containing protein [Neisseriaceae bacterium JH1-16]